MAEDIGPVGDIRHINTKVFRTGDTANKISNHLQVSNVSMQCCRVSLEQSPDCLQVCLCFVKVRLYFNKPCCSS